MAAAMVALVEVVVVDKAAEGVVEVEEMGAPAAAVVALVSSFLVCSPF